MKYENENEISSYPRSDYICLIRSLSIEIEMFRKEKNEFTSLAYFEIKL